MKITWFHHSGVAVETAHQVLVFDYYTQGGRYSFFSEENYKDKKILFFVSHGHGDHFDKEILNWQQTAAYVVSDEVSLGADFTGEVLYTAPNREYSFHGLHIETLRSNDEGVAFLVETEEGVVYHAGDLNWWHWNGEPDAFNQEIAKSYTGEIDRLKGRKIDVAFIPADLRLEDKYFWAIDYFMKTVGAEAVFPIHFWKRFAVCDQLRQLPYGDRIMRITGENQTFSLSKNME